jgi:hypothetical protein
VALGSVVTHEITHLLGLAGHGSGIMRAVFGKRDRLRFSLLARAARRNAKNAESAGVAMIK